MATITDPRQGASNTTAVVTGAASGIGRELARKLASEGHLVYLADIADTRDLAAEIGGRPAVVDVRDPDQMAGLAAAAPDARLICLNAGIVRRSLGPAWEVPPDEWRKLLEVNVLGVVNGLRAFVPQLLASGQPARLLITASLAGLVTFPAGGAYAATKHAVVAIAEQAALALRDTPISVTVLCPALVRTGMSEVGEDPADVAAQALAATRAARFLVMPHEWRGAVGTRTEDLLDGRPPCTPGPDDTSLPPIRES
jgi:NAD(P)-dependent dehydrogenase (short-subunit alcohol dehydrogenase family)